MQGQQPQQEGWEIQQCPLCSGTLKRTKDHLRMTVSTGMPLDVRARVCDQCGFLALNVPGQLRSQLF